MLSMDVNVSEKYRSRHDQLIMNDGSETVIAEYHRRSLGILNSAHDPYLRVSPQSMHMLDLIVATFILVEEKRLDAETQRNDANAFMANTSMANTLMANTSRVNASRVNASMVNSSMANASMACALAGEGHTTFPRFPADIA